MNAIAEISKFDYEGLPRQFQRDSRKRAKRIQELETDTGRNVIEVGKLLKEQRDAFGSFVDKAQKRGRDTWNAWCQAELGWASGRNQTKPLLQIS